MKALFPCICFQHCADALVAQLQDVNQPDGSVEQNVAEMAAATIEKAHVWNSIMPLCMVRNLFALKH
jgi:hypothetical protein